MTEGVTNDQILESMQELDCRLERLEFLMDRMIAEYDSNSRDIEAALVQLEEKRNQGGLNSDDDNGL